MNFVAAITALICFVLLFYLSFKSALLRRGLRLVALGVFVSLTVHAFFELLESRGNIDVLFLVFVMPFLVTTGCILIILGCRDILAHAIIPLSASKERLEHDIRERTKQLQDKIEELQKSSAELAATQSRLVQSEKLASLGHLAAGVAHEINNPLAFVSSNMETLRGYLRDYTRIVELGGMLKTHIKKGKMTEAKQTAETFEKLENEINLDYITGDMNSLLEQSSCGMERIKSIVTDLRTFAREDTIGEMEAVKIERILDSILRLVHNELKHKAELVKDYGNTREARCNPKRMGQVFLNLFVNAVHAIENKGKITVRTYEQDDYICVDVSDTGKGIAPEHLDKIFDPLFTTKAAGEGTGLGLSVSREIIKKHEGKITVKSEAGKGTTFTVMLPPAAPISKAAPPNFP